MDKLRKKAFAYTTNTHNYEEESDSDDKYEFANKDEFTKSIEHMSLSDSDKLELYTILFKLNKVEEYINKTTYSSFALKNFYCFIEKLFENNNISSYDTDVKFIADLLLNHKYILSSTVNKVIYYLYIESLWYTFKHHPKNIDEEYQKCIEMHNRLLPFQQVNHPIYEVCNLAKSHYMDSGNYRKMVENLAMKGFIPDNIDLNYEYWYYKNTKAHKIINKYQFN